MDYDDIQVDDEYLGAGKPKEERKRIESLRMCQILDTKPEKAYDEVTKYISKYLNVPIVAISLVDTDRQWFKSITGIDVRETPRNMAFCAHTILNPDKVLIVEDTKNSPCFKDNPLVISEPYIRFYAGFPITLYDKTCLGTLCAIDNAPRKMSAIEMDTMNIMTKYLTHLIETRKSKEEIMIKSVEDYYNETRDYEEDGILIEEEGNHKVA